MQPLRSGAAATGSGLHRHGGQCSQPFRCVIDAAAVLTAKNPESCQAGEVVQDVALPGAMSAILSAVGTDGPDGSPER